MSLNKETKPFFAIKTWLKKEIVDDFIINLSLLLFTHLEGYR